ncbi:GTPase [Paenibacillus daejeonensis]|uniref:GTPase n=1 Tax=Paenibacillus daejeonensis TaxID=135193 RepID=UPI0003731417|nr:GTPase [Paenibacillus daejeonensis]
MSKDNQTGFQTMNEIHRALEKESQTKINIALFGQPGAGKSSLINAIIGDNVAQVSTNTDTTVAAGSVAWGEDGTLLLTDLPGYGTTAFPAEGYWKRFDLDRYDLFLCVFSGKFHEADDALFRQIVAKGKPCIFVRNFSDTLFDTKKQKNRDELKAEIRQAVEGRYGAQSKVIFTSCVTEEGLSELIDEIYVRLSSSKQAKWERNAKAYSLDFLVRKKKACEKILLLNSAAAAANGLNPVPGLNLAIDAGILQKLLEQIRKSFDLSEDRIKTGARIVPHLASVANNVLKSASFQGITHLLQRQAGKVATQQLSRYVPFIGQAVSATAGFSITYFTGKAYLDDCYEIAEAIFKEELKFREQ